MTEDPQFADRLQRLMDKKGMTRSDLARVVFGTTIETRTDEYGNEHVYEVAKNRQTIGKYLKGSVYPGAKTKTMLCKALGVRYADLFPGDDVTQRPGSGVTLTPKEGERYRLTVDVVLPIAEAMKVISIVSPYAG